MSTVELILKDIADQYVRENFARLERFLNAQIFFDGDFELYDVSIDAANPAYEIIHGLTFIPQDVVFLAIEGDQNFYFKYQEFTKKAIYVFAAGPCRIRFLLGRFSDKVNKRVDRRFGLVTPLGAVPPLAVPKLVQRFDTDLLTQPGDLVRLNGANTVTKILDNTSATIPNGVFGVAFVKPTPTKVDVLFTGIVPGYAGLTPGSPVFISTAGLPIHTAPMTGMVQQIGFATSTTEIFIHLLQAMRRS